MPVRESHDLQAPLVVGDVDWTSIRLLEKVLVSLPAYAVEEQSLTVRKCCRRHFALWCVWSDAVCCKIVPAQRHSSLPRAASHVVPGSAFVIGRRGFQPRRAARAAPTGVACS